MSLPRITPRMTPIQTPLSASVPNSISQTIYTVYPPRLPSAPDIPSRVNPLQPKPPQRRTVMLETIDPHWHNDCRTARLKQRDHYRYHNAWSKYYYGTVAEKEAYRFYTRSVLKQQMVDKLNSERQKLKDRVHESIDAVNYDFKCHQEDAQNFQDKFAYLKTFRDENKRMMETAWLKHRKTREDTDKFDREQLKYNPINWSASLK